MTKAVLIITRGVRGVRVRANHSHSLRTNLTFSRPLIIRRGPTLSLQTLGGSRQSRFKRARANWPGNRYSAWHCAAKCFTIQRCAGDPVFLIIQLRLLLLVSSVKLVYQTHELTLENNDKTPLKHPWLPHSLPEADSPPPPLWPTHFTLELELGVQTYNARQFDTSQLTSFHPESHALGTQHQSSSSQEFKATIQCPMLVFQF